jgi:2-keto-4-pentenoate hydratase/2-oxohepta-3-ene-1,7-dioic acid hydratase in catechol pathway
VRLASFSLADAKPRPGLIAGDEIVDLSDPATGLPPTMTALLALGPDALEGARGAAAGRAARPDKAAGRRPAPVPDPPAILAIGMNYRAHVAELGREPPEWQYWFNKQRTAIAGPGDSIVLPSVSDMVDYEGELALVIGPRCQHVPADRAFEVVAGFTVINDVSARDWQWPWASRSTPTPPAVPRW